MITTAILCSGGLLWGQRVGDRSARHAAEVSLARVWQSTKVNGLKRDAAQLLIETAVSIASPTTESPFKPARFWEQDLNEAMYRPAHVPAEIKDIEEHLAWAEGIIHPEESAFSLSQLEPSLLAACKQLKEWGANAESKRQARTRRLEA